MLTRTSHTAQLFLPASELHLQPAFQETTCSEFMEDIVGRSQERAAARPAWSVLDCSRIESTFGIRPKSWRDELRHVIKQMSDMPALPFGPAHSRVPFRTYPQNGGEGPSLAQFAVAQGAGQL